MESRWEVSGNVLRVERDGAVVELRSGGVWRVSEQAYTGHNGVLRRVWARSESGRLQYRIEMFARTTPGKGRSPWRRQR